MSLLLAHDFKLREPRAAETLSRGFYFVLAVGSRGRGQKGAGARRYAVPQSPRQVQPPAGASLIGADWAIQPKINPALTLRPSRGNQSKSAHGNFSEENFRQYAYDQFDTRPANQSRREHCGDPGRRRQVERRFVHRLINPQLNERFPRSLTFCVLGIPPSCCLAA